MILLLDIGNTHTHVGLSSGGRLGSLGEFPTNAWRAARFPPALRAQIGAIPLKGAAFCSVVPEVASRVNEWARHSRLRVAQLTSLSAPNMRIRYRHPARLGADRVAHALAARKLYGSPVLVVSFGTALTIDAVDGIGSFIGGSIAPGIEAWRDYLGTRTAQLPKIELKPVRRYIGRGTEEAIRSGCVNGFAGMVAALVRGSREEMGGDSVPVIATGGYATEMARRLPEISKVHRDLALEGLRIFWAERIDA